MILLFLNKISKAFAEGVEKLASDLATEANWLMFLMGFETGWTWLPTATNPISKAVGLIQFLPATAAWLGTSVEALYAMSNVEQLYWVQKYLAHMKKEYGPFATYHDLYFAIFYPYAISQPDSYVIGSQEGKSKELSIALQNKGFDLNKNNQVTKAEVKQWMDIQVKAHVPTAYWPEFFKKKTFCSYIKERLSLAA